MGLHLGLPRSQLSPGTCRCASLRPPLRCLPHPEASGAPDTTSPGVTFRSPLNTESRFFSLGNGPATASLCQALPVTKPR